MSNTKTGRKILAVDDDERIVRLVQINLERAGYSVRVALNAASALDLVAQDRPDLIICDVMMPGISGFALVKQLKSAPGTCDIPVIMLTARGGDTDVSDGWHVGVDAYLTKPFSPVELLAFIDRFLPPAAS